MGDVIEFLPDIPPGPQCREVIKRLPTEQLKRAWTAWDRVYEPKDKGDFILEALHSELNERGEGLHCAV